MQHIIVTGAESSGKSTLVAALQEALNCPFCSEYAREYLTDLQRPYDYADLLHIAEGQLAAQNKCINTESESPYRIFDTDLLTIKIWSEYKYHQTHTWVLDNIKASENEIYLLLKPDIPWEFDILRENPDNRSEIYAIYKKELMEYGKRFVEIGGSHEERLKKSLQIIRDL